MDLSKIPQGFKDVLQLEKKLKIKKEDYWTTRGDKRALKLFALMAQRVPAYKDFLKRNRVDPVKIKTINDFKQIPTVDKYNYLRKYPLEGLCWDGNLKEKAWTICTTSGSSGEPYYFPHEYEQDLQYATTAELYLRTNFLIHKRSTLYIDAFMMGAWIGGVFTYSAIRIVAEKGYNISIITPGTDKKGIVDTVKKLGKNFDQVIIGSYAPFLKDVLDDGIKAGLNWKKYNLGFIFSAEGFSEGLRDYVLKISGAKNIYTTTLNHYGSVDLGTMSYETPLSILVRRIAISDKSIYKDLFRETDKLPTLTQFMPELFYFEEVNRTLICSAFSGLPLVRYDLKDYGGVCSYKDLKNILANRGVNMISESKKAGIFNTIWRLPFVFVFERKDFMVKFYLCDIYPETVRKVLLASDLEKMITGKFCMRVEFNKKQDQFLEINIELKSGIHKSVELEEKIAQTIMQQLQTHNLGYRSVCERIGKRAKPKIILWSYENNKYFNPGGKQKWVLKQL